MKSYDFSKVITTGSGGMIGSYVDFGMRPYRSELDVTDEEAVLRFVTEHKPTAIIHLVGATDTQKCEQEPLYAYELNVRAAYNVARAARAVDAVMVYVSTSRVFKGDKETPYAENDTPGPETHYGRTKYMGELIVAGIAPKHIIARTAWVFGGGPERDNKFYGTVLRKLEKSEDIMALNDVHGSPTYAKDFIEEIKRLLANGEQGIFHVVNKGVATRYDLALALAAHARPGAQVRAVDRSFFPSGAELPANEAVISERCTLRPWQDALAEYLSLEW